MICGIYEKHKDDVWNLIKDIVHACNEIEGAVQIFSAKLAKSL